MNFKLSVFHFFTTITRFYVVQQAFLQDRFIWIGVLLFQVKGADPHDEESFRRNVNDVFERVRKNRFQHSFYKNISEFYVLKKIISFLVKLTTQLSNIPTKDDLTAEIGAMEARFTKKLEDLKISVKNMEASINEKLEGLQIGVRNLEVFEELRMDVDHREKLKKGRTRRSTDVRNHFTHINKIVYFYFG